MGVWEAGAFRRQTRSYVCSKNVHIISHVNQMGDWENWFFVDFSANSGRISMIQKPKQSSRSVLLENIGYGGLRRIPWPLGRIK